jgi:hypothetical protein
MVVTEIFVALTISDQVVALTISNQVVAGSMIVNPSRGEESVIWMV